MTLREVASQIYGLTIDGFVNGEQFTRKELEQVLRKWMDHAESNVVPNVHVVELSLPDGRWLAAVSNFRKTHDGYDYYVPDTREEEAHLYQRLGFVWTDIG